jgi:hypothetical protein
MIRTRKAIAAVVLYALGAMATGAALVWLDSEIGDKLRMARDLADIQAVASAHGSGMVEGLSKLAGGDQDLILHLLHVPLVVIGFFFATLGFLPLMIALISHDIVNAEVRQRSARLVLLRCPRGALLAGRMLSHGLLLLAVTIVSSATLFAYAWVRLPSFDAVAAAGYMVEFWFLTLAFGFCYLSLAALVSSLVDGGVTSLIVTVVVLIAFAKLSLYDEPLSWLSPSHWKLGLCSPRVADVAASVAAFLGFGALFFAGAGLRLKRRDV